MRKKHGSKECNWWTAENSKTYVHGFNTTEDVFDVSALSILVGYYPLQMVDSASPTSI